MEEICLLLRELIWHDSTFDSAFSMSHNYFTERIFLFYTKNVALKGLLITSADHEVVKHFSNQKFICLARRPHFLFLEMKFNFSFHLAHSSLVHAETARPLIGQSLYKMSSDWSKFLNYFLWLVYLCSTHNPSAWRRCQWNCVWLMTLETFTQFDIKFITAQNVTLNT